MKLTGVLALGALALALAGCGTAAAAQPSAPAPVSTAATLTSSCVMGYENMQADPTTLTGTAYNYGGFTQDRHLAGVTIGGNQYAPAMAFQMTLTNPGSATANVDGLAVAFYDSSGVEQGSVNAPATGYITSGQSLTWTVRSPLATDGSGTGDKGNQADGQIPPTATSCSLVQWGTP